MNISSVYIYVCVCVFSKFGEPSGSQIAHISPRMTPINVHQEEMSVRNDVCTRKGKGVEIEKKKERKKKKETRKLGLRTKQRPKKKNICC